ncbi:hypothetical protein [Burkholderia vietnamiensis]|uniref:hypothetical protein n=1 Tax=Burkholderia vietnamiensis TaxID=60552 RepID=UPI001B9B4F52|nr:hypothetical protein [Burkholderia vietnamiensis]MBR8279050.1 hypothetical protein [Burkholderia vietnamiensis]
MKASWILPDRAQKGTMLLDQGGSVRPLHEVLPLARLPRAFTLGIPEELFAVDRADPVFFMQYARLDGNDAMFSASLEAGKDVGGRAVVLTLLIQLDTGEAISTNYTAGVDRPASETQFAEDVLDRLAAQLADPCSTLAELLDAVRRFPYKNTFASESLRRSANRPEWMKKKAS